MKHLQVPTSPGKKPNEAGYLAENVDFLRSHLNYIANHAGLSGSDYRVLNAVLDRTLGFRKVADRVSLSVLAAKSGVVRPGRSLSKLEEVGILTFTSGGPGEGANTLTVVRVVIPARGVDPMIHTHGVPSPDDGDFDLTGDPATPDVPDTVPTSATTSRALVATMMSMATESTRARMVERGRTSELEDGVQSLLDAGMTSGHALFYLGLWLGKTRGEHAHLLATIAMEQARQIDKDALTSLIETSADDEAVVSAGYRQGEMVRHAGRERPPGDAPVVPLFPETAQRASLA